MFKKWETAEIDKALAKELAEECGIEPFAALIAASRGYTDAELLEEFLSEDGVFFDTYELPDIAKASDFINDSIEKNDKIAVYGDYDCDGVTASAILYTYLQSRGADVVCYIPDRINEGYGMSVGGIEYLKSQGVKLIITVDNGISCYNEIEYANSIGINVIITDHHIPPDNIPNALAVVNPHLKTSMCGFKDICGAAVAFKLVCAIENAEPEEMMFCYGDLASIGTIGDVMPLVSENRVLVKNGLKSLKENLRPGLTALAEISGVDIENIDAVKVAFTLVPRINAAGRIGSAYRAFKLLVTDNEEEARALANEIYEENANRQQIEKDIFEQAVETVEKENISYDRVIVVSGEDWHQGVIGIVAARLCDKYGKPAVVISRQGDIAFGSGRSIEGFSLYEAISSCASVLEKYGGHSQAAGITLNSENIELFREKINEYACASEPIFPVLKLDCKLNPAALCTELAQSFNILKPYGPFNAEPLFGIFGVCIEKITSIGNNKHIKILFSKKETSFTAVKFGVTAETFEYDIGDTVDIAVKIDINLYNGKEYLSVNIKDMRMNGTDAVKMLESNILYDDFRMGKKGDYSGIKPNREEFAAVYKYLLKKQCTKEALCKHFAPCIASGKVQVISVALEELSLVKKIQVNDTNLLKAVQSSVKVDLNNATIIKALEQ